MPIAETDSLCIQLLSNGVRFFNSSKDTLLQPVLTRSMDSSITVNMGSVGFPVDFLRGQIKHIWVGNGNKFASIELSMSSAGLSWNISIETNTNEDVFTLSQIERAPYLVSLHDDKNKVGLRLLSSRHNNVFDRIDGLRKEASGYVRDKTFRIDDYPCVDFVKAGPHM